jgi:hypothetical protein
MNTLYHVKMYCIILFLTIFMSCSKQSGNTSENQNLTGTWKWIKTDGGIANQIHETPASTGNNIDLKLTENYQYYIYTNGSLSFQGSYTLVSKNCIHDHTNKNVINFSSPTVQDMVIEKVDNLTLELSDEAFDGMISKYSKN